MLGETMREWLELLLPHPRLCSICQVALPPPILPWPAGADNVKQVLCDECILRLPYVTPPLCRQCGRPCRNAAVCRMCSVGLCMISGRSALVYTGVAQEMVTALKFRGQRHLAQPLGELVGLAATQVVKGWPVSAIVPVPLQADRLKARGYNQAALLAERVGARLHKPVWQDVLCKQRGTNPQSGLHLAERAANVRGAFSAPTPAKVSGKRLLLIDDVLTTGATLAAAAFPLLQAGALEIRFATVAVAVTYRDLRRNESAICK